MKLKIKINQWKEKKKEKQERKEEIREARKRRWCDFWDRVWEKAAHAAPPGFDLEKAKLFYLIGVGIAGLVMFVTFIMRWNEAYGDLFEYAREYGGRVLREGALLPGFWYLIQTTEKSFWYLTAFILSAVVGNYSCYYKGSKSIYVMKRLPNRLEIHRRAWTLPGVAILVNLLVMFLVVLLCLAVYFLCSVPACIPEQWLTGINGDL